MPGAAPCPPRLASRSGKSPYKYRLWLALLAPNALLRARAEPRQGAPRTQRPMFNARIFLIVDYDGELRDALVEQLALYEEFESIAVENGTKCVQVAKVG